MTVKVYVDVLFIINFITDYILLSITSFFVKRKPNHLRLILSSAIGGIYAIAACFSYFNPYISVTLSISVAFLMVFMCYGTKSARIIFKNTAVFYLISLCSAGLGFSMMNLNGNMNFFAGAGFFYTNVNAYTLLLIFALAVFVIRVSFGFIKKQQLKSSFLYSVTIEKNGKSVTDTALFDTGNFLREPFSQKSVVVAEWKTVSELFEQETLISCITQTPEAFLYIPCKILNGSTGLYAFSPDRILLDGAVFKEPVLVAISETPLDKDETFKIILPNDFYSPERM